jgi:hypothetical protein
MFPQHAIAKNVDFHVKYGFRIGFATVGPGNHEQLSVAQFLK